MNATYIYANSKLKRFTMVLNQALFSQPYIKQKLRGREVFYVNNDLIQIVESLK
jgi:hypothetical protein